MVYIPFGLSAFVLETIPGSEALNHSISNDSIRGIKGTAWFPFSSVPWRRPGLVGLKQQETTPFTGETLAEKLVKGCISWLSLCGIWAILGFQGFRDGLHLLKSNTMDKPSSFERKGGRTSELARGCAWCRILHDIKISKLLKIKNTLDENTLPAKKEKKVKISHALLPLL